MDRQTFYRELQPLADDILSMHRAPYEALGLFALDLLGTSTLAAGLACNPTTPASLSVNVGPGRVYSLQSLEATAWGNYAGGGGIPASGGLAADTNTDHQVLKQGIVRDTQALALTAPTTPGQSINYLIQVGFSEADTAAVSRSFYNASNPSSPLSGAVSVSRLDEALVQAKTGTAANTGTQTTPAPDTGFVGVWVVTVAYGQTTITAGNITAYPNAPLVLTQAELVALINACYSASNPPTIPDVTGLSAALAAITPGLAQGQIIGLTLANDVTSPNTKIDVSTGTARDSTNTTDLVLSSAMTKDLSAVWAAGTGNGGRDTSTAVQVSSYYHVFLIWNPTGPTIDVLFSQSVTAPTLPTGYTKFRRIGAILTDASGNIRPFVQFGRRVDLLTCVVEEPASTTQGATAVLRTLAGVPHGVKTRPFVILQSNGTVDANVYHEAYTDPDEGVPTLGGDTQFFQIRRYSSAVYGGGYGNYGSYTGADVPCSAAGQLYTISDDAGSVIALKTKGWIDDMSGFN